ncbi:MAG TPA: FtsW/RodA/SpoVE family cell cycle protein [Verrucomicrobiae bacterium]|nr:FtsW/RodA/SpoVE family cell cycle protein [Verrucomicrobiae bacterium]
MTGDSLNKPRITVDYLQIAALVGLMLIGTAFVFSATMTNPSDAEKIWYAQTWFHQIVWYLLGIGAAVAICFVDYHLVARWSFVIYWAIIFCLVIVLVPQIGTMINGARRWIDLGVFQFQPSEFAKLAFILAAAHFLSRPVDELKQPAVFWKGIGLMLLPFVLILKEPDLGSALVLLPTGLVMMMVAGAPHRYLLKLVGAVGVLAVIVAVDVAFLPARLQIPVKDYQRDRLLIYFGRDYTDFAPAGATPEDLQRLRELQAQDGYNIRQALISVGSGGLTGKGWQRGTQNRYGYLPSAGAHNDFIFSVIAEEEGFVGSVIVLTLYAVVLFTGLRIAGRARDRLGKLVAVGVVTLIFSHVFINIGMNIRIMPVTGIPLPLLSYGGSSVLCSLIAMGLMQNVYIHRKGY